MKRIIKSLRLFAEFTIFFMIYMVFFVTLLQQATASHFIYYNF